MSNIRTMNLLVNTFLTLILTAEYYQSCTIRNRDFRQFHSKNKVAALILARGGSKGIPMKNLATVNGRSLLERTLTAIFDAKVFHSVWVSTDNLEIAQEAQYVNNNVNVHWRPSLYATDIASSITAVQDFLQTHQEVENVALIQCTSPFQKATYLKNAFHKFKSGTHDCVFSVTKSFKFRWTKTMESRIVPTNFEPQNRLRRQDWNGEFHENGMFYIATKSLLNKSVFQNDNCNIIEIPEKYSLEVDTYWDLEVANMLSKILDNETGN